MNETFITLKEVAEQLDVHITTLQRARNRGELTTWRIGRGYRTTPEAVEEYLKKLALKGRKNIPAETATK